MSEYIWNVLFVFGLVLLVATSASPDIANGVGDRCTKDGTDGGGQYSDQLAKERLVELMGAWKSAMLAAQEDEPWDATEYLGASLSSASRNAMSSL